MAVDKKISQLTSLAQVDVAASTDVLPIVDTSATETKKITVSALVGAGATAGLTNVDINSGAIDGTTIGASSASTGAFTTLTATDQATIDGIAVGQGGGNITTNTAFGASALNANTTGANNTAVGKSTLLVNTTGQNNTAVGSLSLDANTTGGFNTAVGVQALSTATTARFNTAVGMNAMVFTTTGEENAAFGYQAMYSNTTGYQDTAVGVNALYSNTTGFGNVAVGYNCLFANTTGNSNVALGNFALDANTTGYDNVGIGHNALTAATTAYTNTAVGLNSGAATTTGSGNAFFGVRSGQSNTTGYANTFLGGSYSRYCAGANTTGSSNTAIGTDALGSNTTASDNVAVGYAALTLSTTGNLNTSVGSVSCAAVTTGYENVVMGQNAAGSMTTGFRNVFLGYNSGNYVVATTAGGGNTVVGSYSRCSTAAVSVEVVVGHDLTGKGNQTAFIGGTSGAYNGKNVTTWETTSDARIKKNIIDNHDGLDVIKQIRVRNFEYRKPDEITDLPEHAAIKTEGVQLGVIAQEIREVLPQCVTENSTGVLSVSTDPLVWHLINAVKELSAQVEELKAKLGE